MRHNRSNVAEGGGPPDMRRQDTTKVDTNRNRIDIRSCSFKFLMYDSNQKDRKNIRYRKIERKKSKVQRNRTNTSCTATRNTEKSRYSHHITNHQLTTAILFISSSIYHHSHFLSFSLSFFYFSLLQPVIPTFSSPTPFSFFLLFSSLFLSHTKTWLQSHRVLFSPLPCFSQPLSSTLLSPGKSPTFLSGFITPTNPPCALACILRKRNGRGRRRRRK